MHRHNLFNKIYDQYLPKINKISVFHLNYYLGVSSFRTFWVNTPFFVKLGRAFRCNLCSISFHKGFTLQSLSQIPQNSRFVFQKTVGTFYSNKKKCIFTSYILKLVFLSLRIKPFYIEKQHIKIFAHHWNSPFLDSLFYKKGYFYF